MSEPISPKAFLPFSLAGARRALSDLSGRQLLVRLAFVAGYVAVVFYFYFVDVYNNHFFVPGYSAVYNFARVVFGVYLFFILYTSGSDIIQVLQRLTRGQLNLGIGARIIICFVTGAIVWQFFMLALGYLSLYTRAIAVAVTIPLIIQCSLTFDSFIGNIRQAFRAQFRSYSSIPKFLCIIFIIALLVSAFLLLIVKGLYPSGGHDYYTHYLYYYTTSLTNNGIWPNDVWYHYFYSKGEGIFFLSMLLTDPLAPSLVTYCFIAVATLALFLFIDRMMPGTLWPWTAATCFLLLLIYTPAEGRIRSDGWAEFPKEHEINAAFVVIFVWLCDEMLRAPEVERRLLFWIAAGCAFAMAYVEVPTPIVIGLFAVIVATVLICMQRFRQSFEFLLLAGIAGTGFLSNLILNYTTTGVPNDNLLNIFWPVLNLHKIESLGWVFAVIKHSRDLVGGAELYHRTTFGDLLSVLPNYLHLSVLRAWFGHTQGAVLGLVFALIVCVKWKAIPASLHSSLLLIVALFASFLASAFTLGITNAESFFRYSSFIVPFEFAAGAMVWMTIASLSGVDWVRKLVSVGLPVVATVLFVNQLWHRERHQLTSVVQGGARFVSGRYSIYDAYVRQAAWPARFPFGAVYPGSLAVWKQIGPGTRVWAFHIHAYCVLPACRVESDESLTMTPHMFDILFGPPDRARDILQHEGLNYFLVSRELVIRDPRTTIGLFSPEHIGDYLGVKWTDGTTYLLTWLGPGIEPLGADWLADYRRHVAGASGFQQMAFRTVYERLKTNPAWGYELELPWLH